MFVVPSQGLAKTVTVQQANNNLDVAWFQGRFYLAFRTAPSHFASTKVELHVVSSPDLQRWDSEATFALGRDVREPQLLVIDGQLQLTFAVLGTNPLNFEPDQPRRAVRLGPGTWSAPQPVLSRGFMPWRMKHMEGRAHLLGYKGVTGALGHDEIAVHWLVSTDGLGWEAAVAGQEAVLVGGASETDLVYLDGGDVLAVTRNETGDAGSGFGSKVCRAGKQALGAWSCRPDPRKFDSPLVFRHGQTVYLVGRRNVTPTGAFDLGMDWLPLKVRWVIYEADYWNRPKRCALWRVDPEHRSVEHLLDLPSRGDTCFAEVIKLDDIHYLLFNYTSPLDGPDLTWREGQLGPTLIYWSVLTIP